MCKIFDIHTHVYPDAIAKRATDSLGKFYEFTVPTEGTLSNLLAQATDAGVGGFLILAVATTAHQVRRVNESVAGFIREARGRGFDAYGFAAMHQDTPDFCAELDYSISLGLSGVKIHPDIQGVDIDDERLFRLYSLIEGSFPLYLHMGDERPMYRFSEAKKLAHVLDLFPKLRVAAAHLGGYKAWDDAVKYLAGRENVFFDTSSALWAMPPEYAKELIRLFGAQSVMFGTDFPVANATEELERLFALKLTDEEYKAILRDTAARFLKI